MALHIRGEDGENPSPICGKVCEMRQGKAENETGLKTAWQASQKESSRVRRQSFLWAVVCSTSEPQAADCSRLEAELGAWPLLISRYLSLWVQDVLKSSKPRLPMSRFKGERTDDPKQGCTH